MDKQTITHKFYIHQDIISSITKSVGLSDREDGGMLGGCDGIITTFEFDTGIGCCPGRYAPNTKNLNKILEYWAEKNTCFMGFVHCHLSTNNELSVLDIDYAKRIIAAMGTDGMIAGILNRYNGIFKLTWLWIDDSGNVSNCIIKIK